MSAPLLPGCAGTLACDALFGLNWYGREYAFPSPCGFGAPSKSIEELLLPFRSVGCIDSCLVILPWMAGFEEELGETRPFCRFWGDCPTACSGVLFWGAPPACGLASSGSARRLPERTRPFALRSLFRCDWNHERIFLTGQPVWFDTCSRSAV